MYDPLRRLAAPLLGSLRDLAPIVGVIGFFQFVVLGQPLPDLARVTGGLVLVALGLALFVRGLTLGLFPVGESLADAFARKGSVAWLLVFAFALGFATTVAEPALIAVAGEAARVRCAAGHLADSEAARAAYALGLRYTVAAAVGTALVLGTLRVLRGWPVHRIVIGGYALVVLVTPFAPPEVVGIAYDSGAVTTSTVTVPLVAALGIGLAASIQGRSPLADGFGLIALASLSPMVFVMAYGALT